MNAIQLLTADHKKVRGLLSELEKTTTDDVEDRSRLVEEIARELEIHAQVEEEIFYPAFKAAAERQKDTDMFYEAAEEHHVVKFVLPELVACDPATDEFSAKTKVLKELVEHHAGEEEREMFKRAKALLDESELDELGERLAERKEELGADGELELVGAGARTKPLSQARTSNGARRTATKAARSGGKSPTARRGSSSTKKRK